MEVEKISQEEVETLLLEAFENGRKVVARDRDPVLLCTKDKTLAHGSKTADVVTLLGRSDAFRARLRREIRPGRRFGTMEFDAHARKWVPSAEYEVKEET